MRERIKEDIPQRVTSSHNMNTDIPPFQLTRVENEHSYNRAKLVAVCVCVCRSQTYLRHQYESSVEDHEQSVLVVLQ